MQPTGDRSARRSFGHAPGWKGSSDVSPVARLSSTHVVHRFVGHNRGGARVSAPWNPRCPPAPAEFKWHRSAVGGERSDGRPLDFRPSGRREVRCTKLSNVQGKREMRRRRADSRTVMLAVQRESLEWPQHARSRFETERSGPVSSRACSPFPIE